MTFSSSSLPAVLSSLLFPLLLTVSSTQGQEYEGDKCTVNNGPGICKHLEECPSVYAELLKGNLPLAVCGFIGFRQLVCCPNSTPPPIITTTENAAVVTGSADPLSKKFPHMAAVGYDSPNGVIFSCGGSLISERFVLSAAHCFFSVEWVLVINRGPASWVRVGDMNLESTNDTAKPQQVRIIDRIRHPEYQRPSMYHDIGLLKLESPVTFDEWVRPICLPYFTPDTGNEIVATATGWGKVDWGDENGSNDLLTVTINLINNDVCKRSIHDDRVVPRGVIDKWQICAGEPGKDTCHGDSGGPLVIPNPHYDCMYSLLGITSFGGLCGSIIPGVYTRVSHYVPWIEKNVWPELV